MGYFAFAAVISLRKSAGAGVTGNVSVYAFSQDALLAWETDQETFGKDWFALAPGSLYASKGAHSVSDWFSETRHGIQVGTAEDGSHCMRYDLRGPLGRENLLVHIVLPYHHVPTAARLPLAGKPFDRGTDCYVVVLGDRVALTFFGTRRVIVELRVVGRSEEAWKADVERGLLSQSWRDKLGPWLGQFTVAVSAKLLSELFPRE